ncbi:MAG TPA: hypothetical protein VGU20_01210 [Stellaceae bacterium]|nr:hypothetical protein [Stellaceae bacterium]
MRAIILIVSFLTFSFGEAQADCLREVEVFREHVDALKPTPETEAATRELERIDWAEVRSEAGCYSVLDRARSALFVQLPLAKPMHANAKKPDPASSPK